MTTPATETKTVSHYAKSVIAFGGSLVTFIGAVQAAIVATGMPVPPWWVYGVGVVLSFVTGVIAWGKKNELFFSQVDDFLAANGFRRVSADETLPPAVP
jgi:hypothetical protein